VFLKAKITVFSDVMSLYLKDTLKMKVADCSDMLADILIWQTTRCHAQKALILTALRTSNFMQASHSIEQSLSSEVDDRHRTEQQISRRAVIIVFNRSPTDRAFGQFNSVDALPE
jgi:hypothetical protein